MIGMPQGWVSSSAAAADIFPMTSEHEAFKVVNKVLTELSHEMRIAHKVRLGGYVAYESEGKYTVHVKVMTNSGHTEYEEPWEDFPSEAFKVTLAMVAG